MTSGTSSQDSITPGEFYCPTCEQNFSLGERCPNDGTRLVKLATQIDPFLGRELDGRFTVLEKLGQGGMGSVYRGNQHSVGREVAIKVVNPGLLTQADVIKRFLRECKLASRLSHPNAVGVIDFGQTPDGVLFLVMELVAGRTLDAVIKSERIFKPERVVRIGMQVCDALEGAHALSIVHRDLKPSNIILMSSGRDLVKVLDFGLAKSLAPDQTSTTMTGTGAVLGTPAFMPPELATGQACDARADLYSLGCMLYLLGSGRLPFMSDSVHELVAAHAAETPPPMTGVPQPLASVIDKLLAKHPDDRYQTAAETRQALEDALSGKADQDESGTWNRFQTTPSIGPFPAGASAFANLKDGTVATPMPAAKSGPRKAPSPTDMHRLVASDTLAVTPMPGAVARQGRANTPPAFPVVVAAAPETTQQLQPQDVSFSTGASLISRAGKPKRWGLIIGAGAVAVSAIIGFAVTRGAGGGAAPKAADPVADPVATPTPPPVKTVTTPAPVTTTTPPVTATPTPVATTPPPVIDTPPPVTAHVVTPPPTTAPHPKHPPATDVTAPHVGKPPHGTTTPTTPTTTTTTPPHTTPVKPALPF